MTKDDILLIDMQIEHYHTGNILEYAWELLKYEQHLEYIYIFFQQHHFVRTCEKMIFLTDIYISCERNHL